MSASPALGAASSELAQALRCLDPIALEDMAHAALMDRSETKYLLLAAALPELLTRLAPQYRVLTIEGCAVLPYRSLYLDTPDFRLYYAHHNGRVRRHKVRFRSYAQTDTSFLEVKERRSNGGTVKTRTPVAAPQFPLSAAGAALLGQLPVWGQTLEPKLWVNYSRITLVGRESPERVTLDLGLEFIRPGEQQVHPVRDVVIAELKRVSHRQPSALEEYARTQGQRSGSFSKYGVGCSLLHPVRHNAFKPQVLALDRLWRSA